MKRMEEFECPTCGVSHEIDPWLWESGTCACGNSWYIEEESLPEGDWTPSLVWDKR